MLKLLIALDLIAREATGDDDHHYDFDYHHYDEHHYDFDYHDYDDHHDVKTSSVLY